MRLTPFLRLRCSMMSAQSSNNSSKKLIFAPGSTSASGQADQYTKGALSLSELSPSPFIQFNTWFTHERSRSTPLPEAVTLSTATLPSGKVSARLVYLKELDDKGFVIYSNFATSRKGQDIKSNPYASLTFWWRESERQVRVEGPVERLTDKESQVYYDTRIRSSRLGAWASPQTKVLKDREELDERVKEVEKRFEGQEHIPVPDFWGGLRVIPELVEFWQGRESRLHDRFRYTKVDGKEEEWKIERLAP